MRIKAAPSRRATRVNPSAIGPTPTALLSAATIRKKSSGQFADYRSQDKADPHYYARRTVTQAQARLEQKHEGRRSPVVSESPAVDKGPDH